MSYGFTIQAKSKADAKAKVAEALAGVVASQPVHSNDAPTAQAAADALIDVLVEGSDDRDEIKVDVQGYLTWRGEGEYVQARVCVCVTTDLIRLPVQAAEEG